MHLVEQWQEIYNQWERETAGRGRKEGREEGRKEAKAEVLLQVLEWRFGELPQAVTARVTRASKKTLDRWFQRALGAATRDDVFAR
jgi:predicted transposase YdaD